MDLSITILTYNRWEKTKRLLDSLFGYMDKNIKYEVIIVDNGSTDGTIENLCKSSYPIRVILNQNNDRLLSDNIAFRESKGQYILRLDNDIYFTESFYQELLGALNSEDVGLVVPLINYGGKHQKSNSKFEGNCFDKYKFGSSVWFFRRSLLEEIGNIDSRFSFYCNDIDFQMRVLQRGYKIAIAGKVLVVHDNISSLAIPENSSETSKAMKILKEKWGNLYEDLYGKNREEIETFSTKIIKKLEGK